MAKWTLAHETYQDFNAKNSKKTDRRRGLLMSDVSQALDKGVVEI